MSVREQMNEKTRVEYNFTGIGIVFVWVVSFIFSERRLGSGWVSE